MEKVKKKKKNRRLTTFVIANMLGVSDQSVSNWIDAGQLVAERTPGGHRRVLPEDLIRFLKQKNMRIPPELDPAPPTVLVVDDETEVAEWIASQLRERCGGCRILLAHDGFDAGRIVVTERPDVVVLDLYMPGMDGFEVCRRIKADARTAMTKVVAVTAHPSAQAERAIGEAGAEGYLPKPLKGEQLAAMVLGLMGMPVTADGGPLAAR